MRAGVCMHSGAGPKLPLPLGVLAAPAGVHALLPQLWGLVVLAMVLSLVALLVSEPATLWHTLKPRLLRGLLAWLLRGLLPVDAEAPSAVAARARSMRVLEFHEGRRTALGPLRAMGRCGCGVSFMAWAHECLLAIAFGLSGRAEARVASAGGARAQSATREVGPLQAPKRP